MERDFITICENESKGTESRVIKQSFIVPGLLCLVYFIRQVNSLQLRASRRADHQIT